MNFKKIVAFFFVLYLFSGLFFTSAAGEGTTYTFTLSTDDEWIRTQDAYLPGAIYMKGKGLNAPKDLFVKNGLIYIADTGNGRVAVFNPQNGEINSFGENILKNPCGLFVLDDGTVYVADEGLPAVVVFSPDKTEIMRITRPKSHLFSDSAAFAPRNVVVTAEKNIFVVSTGTYEGLLQFSDSGEFQGFFAANKRPLNLLETVQDLIYTEKQKDSSLTRIPRQIENIDISAKDLIYSVTQSASHALAWSEAEAQTDNSLKLHNMAGTNILARGRLMSDEWNFVDVASGSYGNSYALTYTGLIYEYDSGGNLVFSFGGRAVSSERNGLFTVASAVDVDENGLVYVLDMERALIQVFCPTDFAVTMHKAIFDLESGNYESGEQSWRNVLRLNGMSKSAHIGYGKSLFHQQKFEQALEEFRIANDKAYYSETFWELRSNWMKQNIFIILIAVLLLSFALMARGYVKKKKTAVPAAGQTRFLKRKNLLTDVLYAGNIIRHPVDSYYYLKKGQKGSAAAASIIYGCLILVFLCDSLFRGFIFNGVNLNDTSLIAVLSTILIPLLLWVVGNFMVCNINSGEGSFKNVYIMSAYALAPYLIIAPIVVVLSHVLTMNEAFIISFLWIIAVAWSAVTMFIGIMQTHSYTFKMAVKNVLLTLFFMVMAIVVMAIMYMLWGQIMNFLKTLWAEVTYRVSK